MKNIATRVLSLGDGRFYRSRSRVDCSCTSDTFYQDSFIAKLQINSERKGRFSRTEFMHVVIQSLFVK